MAEDGKPSRSPGPGHAGPLAARAGYDVGYAKPPEATRFQTGQSGNPRGRPKGAKTRVPGLNEERMKAIILQEAYRDIKVRDGERNITVPIVQAVLRSLAVNAVKGQHRSQRLFAELLSAVETSNKTMHNAWMQTAMQYKVDWEIELDRRARLGITGAHEPLPHPDHIVIDLHAGTARIIGPSTKENKAAWDKYIAQKLAFETEFVDLQATYKAETNQKKRQFLVTQIVQNRRTVELIEKAEKGEI